MSGSSLEGHDTRPPAGKRLPELDGIRGCAILLVLVWHYLQNQLQPAIGSPLGYFRQALGFTWSGVDLFFVLSGFLIAGILLEQRESPGYFRTFYLRRVCRIFPLYYINLSLFLLFSTLPLAAEPPYTALTSGSEVPLGAYFSFTQNLFMALHNSAGIGWLGVTWSLAVEEQFYLVLPLLVWLLPRHVLPYVFVWIIISAVCLREYLPGLSAYINTPWRADALLCGALLAWLVRNPVLYQAALRLRRLLPAGLLLGAAGLLYATVQGYLRLGGTWTHLGLALFYSALILHALLSPGGLAGALFRSRPLVWLGAVSYGVYLMHTWISRLVHALLRNAAPAIHSWSDAGVTLLALLVTLLLAHASFHWIESRIIRFGHRARY